MSHWLGLLSIIAFQVCEVFADSATPLEYKLAAIVGTCVPLVFADTTKQRKVTVALVGAGGMIVPLATFAIAKLAGNHVHWAAVAVNVLTVVKAVFVRLPALLPTQPQQDRAKDAGHALPPLLFLVLFASLGGLLALTMMPRWAHADDTVGDWTQAWTIGGAAVSFNLRDGAITAADQGGSCYSLTNTRWHLGADLCLYFRLATKGLPNAFTPTVGAHYRQAGIGFGLMKSGGDPLAPVLRLTGQLPILGGS